MKKMNVILLLVGLMVYGSAYAEQLIAADFVGQPSILLKEGVLQSCGIRFVGFENTFNPDNPKESIRMSDASFMLDRKGYGLVKATLSMNTVGGVQTHKKQVTQPFRTFWIKAPNADATKLVKGQAVVNGDSINSKLYITDALSVMALHSAVAEQKPIQIGIKFDDDTKDFAFFGKVTMTDSEAEQVSSCMNELIGLIEKDIDKNVSK